ncbi:32546_t:CDS:1, partial [Racocetra persica]
NDTRGIEQSTAKTIFTKIENFNDTSEQIDLQTKNTLISDIMNNIFSELSKNKLNNAPNSDISFKIKRSNF